MYIQILGPICSGKSSLAKLLSAKYHAEAYFEPTATSTVYPLFKTNKQEHAFRNQIDFMCRTFDIEQRILSKPEETFVIQDTGLIVCHHIYNHYFRDKNYITDKEHRQLTRLFEKKIVACKQPDQLIYISAPIDILKKRFVSRDKFAIHDIDEIMVYWEKLLASLQAQNRNILFLNSETASTEQLAEIVISGLGA
jgi:deoxyguanosine kinase